MNFFWKPSRKKFYFFRIRFSFSFSFLVFVLFCLFIMSFGIIYSRTHPRFWFVRPPFRGAGGCYIIHSWHRASQSYYKTELAGLPILSCHSFPQINGFSWGFWGTLTIYGNSRSMPDHIGGRCEHLKGA